MLVPGTGVATGFKDASGKGLLVSKIAYIAGGLANITSLGVASDALLDTHGGYSSITLAAGAAPRGIAISPDNSIVYVSNTGLNSLTKIVTATGATSVIALGITPGEVAFSPDGTFAYIASRSGTSIAKIIVATDAVSLIPVGLATNGVAFHPSGSYAYFTNYLGTTVTKLICATDVFSTITVGAGPQLVAIAPNGNFAIVSLYDVNVAKIITATELVSLIPTCISPRGVAISPDNSYLYVCDLSATSIAKVIVSTEVVTLIPAGDGTPYYVKFFSNGLYAYISKVGGTILYKIDTSTNNVVQIPAVNAARTIAINSTDSIAYIANNTGSVTVLVTQPGIASMPALVGATLTPASTGRPALQTVNGYLAAVFSTGPADQRLEITSSTKSLFVVTRWDAALPIGAAFQAIATHATNVGLLINVSSSSMLTVGEIRRDSILTSVVDNNVHFWSSVNALSGGGVLRIGNNGSLTPNWQGPLWGWCVLSNQMTSTQVTQIDAAFKEFFRNLGLP